MRRYSDFFVTLYDEKKPVGCLGRGTHYSVLRHLYTARTTHEADLPPMAQDFAVIWDEDHDRRVIWAAEELISRGMFARVLFIGERKGGVTILIDPDPVISVAIAAGMESAIEHVPDGDIFNAEVSSWFDCGSIINASAEKVSAYLGGIFVLWKLGVKSARRMHIPGPPKPPAVEVRRRSSSVGT